MKLIHLVSVTILTMSYGAVFAGSHSAIPRTMGDSAIASKLDTTPPAISEFTAKPIFNVARPPTDWGVKIAASDDKSGVYQMVAFAAGPSGQQIAIELIQSFPDKKFQAVVPPKLPQSAGYAYLKPEVYTFYQMYISDYAGNETSLDASALASLGNASFLVKNERGFDLHAPTLISGEILTPTISIHATHPGTPFNAHLGVKFTLTDSGDSAISGLHGVRAVFCKSDNASFCFSIGSEDSIEKSGIRSMTVKAGKTLGGNDVVIGEYHLRNVLSSDHAGNIQFLLSTEYGGSVDFTEYFGSTTITVTP